MEELLEEKEEKEKDRKEEDSHFKSQTGCSGW